MAHPEIHHGSDESPDPQGDELDRINSPLRTLLFLARYYLSRILWIHPLQFPKPGTRYGVQLSVRREATENDLDREADNDAGRSRFTSPTSGSEHDVATMSEFFHRLKAVADNLGISPATPRPCLSSKSNGTDVALTDC